MSGYSYLTHILAVSFVVITVRTLTDWIKAKKAAKATKQSAEPRQDVDTTGCPFLAVVALPSKFLSSPEELIEKIKSLYPSLPFKVCDPFVIPAELASFGNLERPADDFFAIKLGETAVFVTGTSKNVLVADFEDAISNSIEWPEARDKFSKLSAEVAVSRVGRGDETIEEKRLAALKTMIVASAIAELGGGFAVKWFESEMLIRPDVLKQLIADCFDEKWPTSVWVNFKNITGTVPSRSLASELVTGGLSSFIGREMQFLPVALEQEQLNKKAFLLADYLIKFGPVFRDGLVITSETDESVHIKHVDSGYWSDTKYLQIEIKNPQLLTVH